MSKPLTATNDFVVKFANVNGSGSASANGLFAKVILRMGVPVAARKADQRDAALLCYADRRTDAINLAGILAATQWLEQAGRFDQPGGRQ